MQSTPINSMPVSAPSSLVQEIQLQPSAQTDTLSPTQSASACVYFDEIKATIEHFPVTINETNLPMAAVHQGEEMLRQLETTLGMNLLKATLLGSITGCLCMAIYGITQHETLPAAYVGLGALTSASGAAVLVFLGQGGAYLVRHRQETQRVELANRARQEAIEAQAIAHQPQEIVLVINPRSTLEPSQDQEPLQIGSVNMY